MAKMTGGINSRSVFFVDLIQTPVNNSKYYQYNTKEPISMLRGGPYIYHQILSTFQAQREPRIQASIPNPQCKPSFYDTAISSPAVWKYLST